MPVYDWWMYILLAIPGIILFVLNWAIFIHNQMGKKYSSNVPPLGGLWIAGVCLLSPVKWLALIGLADPGFWLLVFAILAECLPGRNKNVDKKDVDKKDVDKKDLDNKD